MGSAMSAWLLILRSGSAAVANRGGRGKPDQPKAEDSPPRGRMSGSFGAEVNAPSRHAPAVTGASFFSFFRDGVLSSIEVFCRIAGQVRPEKFLVLRQGNPKFADLLDLHAQVAAGTSQ